MQTYNWIIEILESYSDSWKEEVERINLGMNQEEYDLYKQYIAGINDDWLMIS